MNLTDEKGAYEDTDRLVEEIRLLFEGKTVLTVLIVLYVLFIETLSQMSKESQKVLVCNVAKSLIDFVQSEE